MDVNSTPVGRKVSLLVACWAGLGALGAGAAWAKSPLPYFGYYNADTDVYGHYMDKMVIPGDTSRLYDFSNLLMLDIGHWGQADPRRAIIDAANLGYKIMIYGASGYDKDNPSLWASGFAETQRAVHGYEDYIYSVDLVDEPDGWGWSRDQVESLVSQARTYFRGSMPITVNINFPDSGISPRNLDVYTFDYYINYGGGSTTFAQYTAAMNAKINALRTAGPGKPICIIADSFSLAGAFAFPSAAQEQWYYDTAVNTPEVTGLMWFMMGNNPGGEVGAISHPETLAQHKQMGLQVVQPQPGLLVDDRFDSYQSQAAVNAVYSSGQAPALVANFDHGSNGGKSLRFGAGLETATRQVSVSNTPGAVSAFLYDATTASSDYFGFRAVNTQGKSIAIYVKGDSANYLIDDQGHNLSGLNTQTPSLSHWQKVEFDFDGLGIRVYADSLLVYQASDGWQGGYSSIGFYDLMLSSGVGYIDDIRAAQRAPSGLTTNFAADSNIGSISLQASTANIGRDGAGNNTAANVLATSLSATGYGANYVNTTLAGNRLTVSGSFQIDKNATLVKQGPGLMVVNGAQTHGMGALLIVNEGRLDLNSDAGSPVSRHLILDANSTTSFGSSQHLAALRVGPGAKASVLAGGNKVLVTGSLSIASGGKLDLSGSSMVVDYDVSSPINTARQMLLDGRLLSSVTSKRLGYAEATVLGVTSFIGEVVDSTSVCFRTTFGGDANLDGLVNISDLGRLATNWQTSNVWTGGDFDYSGFVDISDLGILATNWQAGVSSPSGAVSFERALESIGLNGVAVPEPGGAAIVLALGLLNRRRR